MYPPNISVQHHPDFPGRSQCHQHLYCCSLDSQQVLPLFQCRVSHPEGWGQILVQSRHCGSKYILICHNQNRINKKHIQYSNDKYTTMICKKRIISYHLLGIPAVYKPLEHHFLTSSDHTQCPRSHSSKSPHDLQMLLLH